MITPGKLGEALLHGDDDIGVAPRARPAATRLHAAALAGVVVAIGCWRLTSSLLAALVVLALWLIALLKGQRLFSSALPDSVIVLGQGSVATLLTAMLAEKPSASWRTLGRPKAPTFRRMSTIGEASEGIRTSNCRCIVLADPLEARRIPALMSSVAVPLRVIDGMHLLERSLGRIPIELTESEIWPASAAHSTLSPAYLAGKRVMDVSLALIVGLMILPVFPIIMVAILIDSGRPIFYKQTRVGYGRSLFLIIKFRTMRADAERDGAVWAAENDPRVTRFGRVMRRTRMDELPQLWNVLRGDMSLIGPRPERPEFVDQLERDIPAYRRRHAVRPGLTGWAQVRFRYTSSLHDSRRKLEYDLYYLRNASFLLDLRILVRTIGVVLGRKGR